MKNTKFVVVFENENGEVVNQKKGLSYRDVYAKISHELFFKKNSSSVSVSVFKEKEYVPTSWDDSVPVYDYSKLNDLSSGFLRVIFGYMQQHPEKVFLGGCCGTAGNMFDIEFLDYCSSKNLKN